MSALSRSPRLLEVLLTVLASVFSAQITHAQSTVSPSFVLAETDRLAFDPAFGGLLSCSPAPCLLPPTQASEGGNIVNDAPIVADPNNVNHLLLGANDFNCGELAILGFYTSTDGGTNWNRTCMLPLGVYSPSDGQPLVAYDLVGTAYIAGSYQNNGNSYLGLIAVQKSADGVAWSQPTAAIGSVNQTNGYPFYPWMVVDTSPSSPFANSIYISAVGKVGNFAQDRVVVSHSRDGGTTWTVVHVAPWQKYPAGDDNSNMTIGKDGTIYLTWEHCPGTGADTACTNNIAYMVFSKSSDGGSTWSKPSLITAITHSPGPCCHSSGMLPNSNVFVENIPVIGVDNSNGPHAGNLYLVTYDWTGTYMQVRVMRSTDKGSTWSQPVPVAPPSVTHDQFFSWLSVSQNGIIGVSWLDRRNDPLNISYQAFAAFSGDGGVSFSKNYQLTTAFSNPNNNGYANQAWMGDYTGNTWAGSTFHVAWMDTSNGVDTQDVVGGIRVR